MVTVKQLIERMQQESNFPAVSEHIAELNRKAAPTSESSAHELANLILRDYALTSRLLKVSNSAMYGQFSGTISTISRAVVVLGFEQVQLTATGLIFFEHLQDKSKSHYLKEAVLGSFLSGILARDLAKNQGLDGWENYYIGAMFHNFGRLLCMHYFAAEFSGYEQLVKKGGLDEEAAQRQALGVSFAELGIGIARSWSLPDQIVVSMKIPGETALKGDVKKIDHQQLLPRFANELCEVTMNAAPEQRRLALVKVVQRYAKIYPMRLNELMQIIEAGIKEMEKFSDVLHLDRNDLKRLKECSFAESAPEKAEQAAEAGAETPAAPPSLRRFEVAEPEQKLQRLATAEQRKQHLQNGIQEITNVMLDEFSLDQVLSMILETIYRGIGFDRVLIFFKDPRADQLLARYGLGSNTAKLIKAFSFPIAETARDLFSRALFDAKDLYVGNISDPDVRGLKPDWFAGEIFSPSFAIYPLIINKRLVGMIYGGHNDAGEHLSSEQLGALKTLRNQAALAIKQAYSGS